MKVTNEVTTGKKVTNIKTEAKIQQEIILFFSQKYEVSGDGFIFSVPNGGSRNIIEAKNLKNTGVRAGVADIVVVFKTGLTVFFEVKTETGVQSESQKQFENTVKKLGFDYYLVRNLEQFQKYVEISHKKADFLKSLDEYKDWYHNVKNNVLK